MNPNLPIGIFVIVKYIYIFFSVSFLASLIGCQTEYDHSQLRVAYNVLVDPETDNYDIYVLDLQKETPVNISNSESTDWVYSAHNEKLYVVSDRDTCKQCYFLYETDSQGSYWKKISNIQIQDSWVSSRKSGKELIIKPKGMANEAFKIIDNQGKIISTLDLKMDYFKDPCFSPDGKSIVFRGYDGNASQPKDIELYTYNLITQEKIKITQYPQNDSTFGIFQYRASPARWNDKLGKITYSSSRNGQSKIMSIETDSYKTKSLTQGNVKSVWHDVSPDGQFLVFDGQLDYKADSTTSHIFIMDFKNRNSKRITKGSDFKWAPVFVYEKR